MGIQQGPREVRLLISEVPLYGGSACGTAMPLCIPLLSEYCTGKTVKSKLRLLLGHDLGLGLQAKALKRFKLFHLGLAADRSDGTPETRPVEEQYIASTGVPGS